MAASRRRRRIAGLTLALALLLAAALWLFLPPPGVQRFDCAHQRIWSCQQVIGRVVHIQRHDADGDGDVHIVLASKDSLTRPGVSVVKISAGRRPAHLPGLLEWVSAMGSRYPGESNEMNLNAVRLRTRSALVP